MGDRYRSGRGYVPYDYRCKGRTLEGAAVVFVSGRRLDGTPYRRRMTTGAAELAASEVIRRAFADLKGAGRPAELERVLKAKRYLDPLTMTAGLEPSPGAARLEFTTTAQRLGGVRAWWLCPRCARRCAKVYAVKGEGRETGEPWGVVGCRVCLGLAYPSQSEHKSAHRDYRLHTHKVRGSDRARAEARERIVRRCSRVLGR